MQGPTPCPPAPRRPGAEPTFSPVSVIADTIVRTVELGVTIIDAAIEGATTVVWCDLLPSGPGRPPGCGQGGARAPRSPPLFGVGRGGGGVMGGDAPRGAHPRHAAGDGYVTVIVD